MESNGKSVNSFNENISNSPCSFIFGEVGTDAQHSFFQALHQSTLSFTGDLICFSNNLNSEFCIFDDYDKNNSKDLQNFAISQYFAFKNGSDKTIESVHKQVKGNKPVDLFIFNKLNEYTLGQLLCIYEYKTLFEASFSDINPFDQYGVELGKQIFKNL
jgi:glucose-6-phosphate isomerase